MVQVQNDIKKVVVSQQGVDELNAKAQQMAINAQGFEAGSRSLERQMFWRNMRLIIIIIEVILMVILIRVLVKYT